MSWVTRAKERGASRRVDEATQSKEASKTKTNIEAELPVTEMAVALFLEPFQAPMKSLAKDLQDAGYTVIENVGYCYHSDVSDNCDTSSFSLASRRSSYRGLTDYEARENYVYGYNLSVINPDRTLLFFGHIYPKVNEKTHYAAVEYHIPGPYRQPALYSKEVSNITDLPVVITELREVISGLIQEQALKK